MPQVPFTGTQSVGPVSAPESRYRADVSAETFGGATGAALSSLGGQLQRSGNELFERGMAMQELYNRSAAQDADADFMEKAGLLHAEYSSLQGKNKVDAYPKYITDLKTLQEKIKSGLPNETAQKLFDSASKGTLGRTIFSGAGEAATANKQYALGSSKARISAIGNQTLSRPEDERSFNEGLATTEAEVRGQANLLGLGPEATEEAVSTQKSALWGQRIQGLAKQQPIAAGKMLEDGIKRGDIRGEDIGKLTNIVQQARNTVGARQISVQVNSGAGSKMGEGIVPIEQAAYAIGQFESGGRYNLQGVETKYGRALGKYQVMEKFLPEFLRDAGMPPMTKEEYLNSPAAQDKLFNTRFGQYMKETGSFNDAASKWFTGKPLAQAGDVKDAHGTTAQRYVSATNAILARNAPLDAKVREGDRIAKEMAPDDPLFPDIVQQRIKIDNETQVRIRRDTEWQNKQAVVEGLMGGQDGKLPTTVEELTNTPERAQAWQDLPHTTQKRYMDVLARNASGTRVSWNQDNLRQYQQLQGMAQTDPAKFIEQDIISMNIPNSAKLALIKKQQHVYGDAEGDPGIRRALQILAPDLSTARISKKQNEDEYYQFVGTLSDQIQQFMNENKRPPKVDELKTMGARLLQAPPVESLREPGMIWGRKTTPTFRVPVPREEYEKIKADPLWAETQTPNPTDEQIQRVYSRALYKKLYGGTAKKQATE